MDFRNSEASRSIYGHIDFLGKGATTVLEDVSPCFVTPHTFLTLARKDGLSKHNDQRMPTMPFFSSRTSD